MKCTSCAIPIAAALIILLLGFNGDDSSAAPCTPCQSWGAIKTCASSDPSMRRPCCDCTKDILIDFAIKYYLYLDGIAVSPMELLIILESDFLANKRMIDQLTANSVNDTWGIIRAFYYRNQLEYR